MNKNFALVGAAGYIAPRHMEAIKKNNCSLLAAVDKNDSVGIIDSYFPNAEFFTEIERFDRHIDKLKDSSNKIDFFSICSPNYLHDSHIRLALRNDAHAICEKPLVINPDNLIFLKKLKQETGKEIFTILQLRHHKSIIDLKDSFKGKPGKQIIKLEYMTARGKWYHHSWKGEPSKSGGLCSNIGIHFFDMLIWVFGSVIKNDVHINNNMRASGILELEHAIIDWTLSIDKADIPTEYLEKNIFAYRNIKINDVDLEFSDNFKDLHIKTYSEILNGRGFTISDAEESIGLVYNIQNNIGV